MILFGKPVTAELIAALVASLMTLVIWIGALRGERGRIRWLRQWEADRKARREAEAAAEGGGPPAGRGGPWG